MEDEGKMDRHTILYIDNGREPELKKCTPPYVKFHSLSIKRKVKTLRF